VVCNSCLYKVIWQNFRTFKGFSFKSIEVSPKVEENQNKIKRKIKRIPNFRCHRCPRVFCSHVNVLSHIANIHYKKKLQRRYGENAKKCGTCEKEFEKQSTLFCHLVTSHGILESRIPEKGLLMMKDKSTSKIRQKSKTTTDITSKSGSNVNLQVHFLIYQLS